MTTQLLIIIVAAEYGYRMALGQIISTTKNTWK